MDHILSDKEYNNIVNGIINNDEYLKIDNFIHHGTSRLDHCYKVSYYSYKITKALKLDYRATAKGGLLHDFYLTQSKNSKDKIESLFKHPSEAVINADNNFILNDLEKNIISSHMFPLLPLKAPAYVESWVVSIVDKGVAIYEFGKNYENKFKFKLENVMIMFIVLSSRLF